jgi:hypothetical protein
MELIEIGSAAIKTCATEESERTTALHIDVAQGTVSELLHGLTQLDHNGDASHQVVRKK